MTENQKKRWDALLKILRKRCPINKRVIVLRRDEIFYNEERLGGSCSKNKTGYTIKIKTLQPWQSQIDTLIHEWAHALNFQQNKKYDITHGEEWGKCFSKAYAAYEEWIESD